MGGRSSSSNMGGSFGMASSNVSGGGISEVSASANPAKIAKIDDRLQNRIGYTIDEAIAEVRHALMNVEDDFTANYLREQLPKLADGTIKMKDLDEIMQIIS